MFCHQCGTENDDKNRFCTACGAQLQAETPVTAPADPQGEQRPQGEVFTYQVGAFAYAKIVSLAKTGYFYCECIDGVSVFFADPAYTKRPDRTPASIGDYIWVRLTEFIKVAQGKSRYKTGYLYDVLPANKRDTIIHEYEHFKRYYKCGDLLLAPVERVDNTLIVVRVAPTLTAVCYVSNLPVSFNIDQLSPDSMHAFAVCQFDDTKNRIVLQPQGGIVEDKTIANLWSWLPESMRDVIIPDKMLAVVQEQGFTHLMTEKPGDPLTKPLLSDYLEPIYQKEYAAKRITIKQTATTYFMDFDTGLRNEKGVPMSAAFKRVKKPGSKWILNLFGFTHVESVFDRFIYVEDFSAALTELAGLALSGEEWDYGGEREKGKKFILKQYLRFNFYKSWLDDLLIINDQGDAVFNTGLVDGAYDAIYCYLKKNTHAEDFFCRRWALDCFACWGKGKNGKALNIAFAARPAVPQYIDPNRIQDIYYNITKELSCDYDHIVEDNLSRLPLDFIAGELSRYDEVMQAVDAYKASNSYKDFETLRELILGTEHYLRRITEGLRQSVETAKKYCEWNYKTAIPIYYPRNNAVSLLLPLCLTNDHNRADVALVVERLANGNYQGQTILTLQMAYLDARQICRPNSEWLTVDNIGQDGTDPEDEAEDET